MPNSKNYHIELRKNTSLQEILLEDDIFATKEHVAITYLEAWATAYLETFSLQESLVIVCTNNWTEKTAYQSAFGCYRHALDFVNVEHAKAAHQELFRTGWKRDHCTLTLQTRLEMGELTQEIVLRVSHPSCDYTFNTFVAEPFGE